MPKAKVFNMAGKEIGEIELSEAIFGIEPNKSVLHDSVKNTWQIAVRVHRVLLPRAKLTSPPKSPGVRRVQAVHVPVMLELRNGRMVA